MSETTGTTPVARVTSAIANELARHGCQALDHTADGWKVMLCDCGEDLGLYPDDVTAVDALCDHMRASIGAIGV